jgi:hypothetical protein
VTGRRGSTATVVAPRPPGQWWPVVVPLRARPAGECND